MAEPLSDDQAVVDEFLRLPHSKVRTLTDDAPVLLCMIDPDDRLVFANSRFLQYFGRTLEDMSSGRWNWTADVHPDDLPEVQRRWVEAMRRQESTQFEHRVRRHDGEYRWVQESEIARFTPEGTFAGFVGALVDITDRKHAEAARHASEARVRAILDSAFDAIITLAMAKRIPPGSSLSMNGTSTTSPQKP